MEGQSGAPVTCSNTSAKHELRSIPETDGLLVAPFRDDGPKYGTFTCVGFVVGDGGLCPQGHWEAITLVSAHGWQRAGRITDDGIKKKFSFEPMEGHIQERLHNAYQAKHRNCEYLARCQD